MMLLNNEDTTVGKLTADQLRAAANDLRNAALVVYYAGHGRGAMTNRKTGTVCALGAIELATARRLITSRFNYGRIYWLANVEGADHPGTEAWNRANAATLVLAENIPTHLCVDCVQLHDGEPWRQVTHYNDTHCQSGSVLYRMLRQAAEQADEWADQRRMVAV